VLSCDSLAARIIVVRMRRVKTTQYISEPKNLIRNLIRVRVDALVIYEFIQGVQISSVKPLLNLRSLLILRT
jgi:hypothetical protein